MTGQQTRNESLFYYFRLEEQIPEDHLLRLIDRYVDLSFVRERLKQFYSWTGRPSIDPEVLSLVHTAGLRGGDPGPLHVFEKPARTLSAVGGVSGSVRRDRGSL